MKKLCLYIILSLSSLLMGQVSLDVLPKSMELGVRDDFSVIYMESIDGENGHGKIMGNANGLIQFSTGDEFRVAAGKQCLIAKDKFNMVGNIIHAGEADMGNPLGKSSIFKSIMAGGWDSILSGVIKSCK